MKDCSNCMHYKKRCSASKEEIEKRKALQKMTGSDCFETTRNAQKINDLNNRLNSLFEAVNKELKT